MFAPGRINTRRTRRASGRVFRGDLRGCWAASGWFVVWAHSGHAAQPKASGENYHLLTSRRIRGLREHSGFSWGESRDTWRLGGLPGVVYCLGTRNGWQVRVASGGSYLPGALGDKCRVRKTLGGCRLELRDAWRTRTTSGKCSLVRHSGTRVVFRLVPEGFIGRVWGHVSSSERAPEGGVLRASFR